MPVAPTPISYTETVWNTTGVSKASASISWQAGDVIAVIAGCEDNSALGVPTAAGLAFTSQKSNVVGSTCASQLATAVAASSSSGAVTVTNASSAPHWGFGVWVWRNSAGVGNSAEQHTTTATVPLIPTGADSAIVYGVFDFSAGALQTITPTPTNTRQRVVDGTQYSIYVMDLADQVSAGSVSYGLAGGAGTVSIVVLEVKGGVLIAPRRVMRPFPFKPGSARR